jgi:hypothetical protein
MSTVHLRHRNRSRHLCSALYQSGRDRIPSWRGRHSSVGEWETHDERLFGGWLVASRFERLIGEWHLCLVVFGFCRILLARLGAVSAVLAISSAS